MAWSRLSWWCSPAGVVAQLLAVGDPPLPETTERLAVEGVGLAAVHCQLSDRDLFLPGLAGDPLCQAAGADRLGLEWVADHPHHRTLTGRGGPQHRVCFAR